MSKQTVQKFKDEYERNLGKYGYYDIRKELRSKQDELARAVDKAFYETLENLKDELKE